MLASGEDLAYPLRSVSSAGRLQVCLAPAVLGHPHRQIRICRVALLHRFDRDDVLVMDDRIIGIAGVTVRAGIVWGVAVDLIGHIIVEIELGREDVLPVDMDLGMDMDGPSSVPPWVDRGELDYAMLVGHLCATEEGRIVLWDRLPCALTIGPI